MKESQEDDGIPEIDEVLLWRLENRKKKRMLDENSIAPTQARAQFPGASTSIDPALTDSQTTSPLTDPALVSPKVFNTPKTAKAAKGGLIPEGILTLVPLPTKGANSLLSSKFKFLALFSK